MSTEAPASEGTLTSAQRTALAEELLELGRRYVFKQAGPECSEYVGECLADMLGSYDGPVSGFRDHFFRCIVIQCVQKTRDYLGRVGSVKWKVRSETHTIETSDRPDEDLADPHSASHANDIEYRGSMATALKRADREFTGRDRLVGITAVLGTFRRHEIAAIHSNETQFASVEQLFDAIMLFGARLTGADGKRLLIHRTARMFPVLAWAVVQLERHGIGMRYKCGEYTAAVRAIYVSRTALLFDSAYRRWYGEDGHAATPADLTIDTRTLIYWLVPAACSKTDRQTTYRLTAPRMPVAIAEKYARQIRSLTGWRCQVRPTAHYACIHIKADVRTWLGQYVPPRVWGGQ